MSDVGTALSPARYAARVATLALLGGFMLWGPLWVQVLHKRASVAVPWMMFHGVGASICTVEYRDRSADGREQPIDRFERLHTGPSFLAPWRTRNVRGRDHARALGATLCADSPTGDVRVVGRCAGEGAWSLELRGDENLCAAEARAAAFPPMADAPPWQDVKP